LAEPLTWLAVVVVVAPFTVVWLPYSVAWQPDSAAHSSPAIAMGVALMP
jgi:hypothetical protein